MTDNEKLLHVFFKEVAQRYDVIKRGTAGFQAGKTEGVYFKQNLAGLQKLISNGWTDEMIRARLKCAKLEGVQTDFITDVIPAYPPIGSEEKSELLKEGVVHTHPELRVVQRPIYNEDGSCESSAQISRRTSFTLGDLVNYFNRKLKPNPQHPRGDVLRTLRATLNKGYSVDQVLSAIDLWAFSNEESMGSRLQDLAWVWVRKVKND